MSFYNISVKQDNYKRLRDIQIKMSQESEDGSFPSWNEVISHLLDTYEVA